MIEQTDFDDVETVVFSDPEQVGPDELYDLRDVLRRADADALADRVEIERHSCFIYDNYIPTFTTNEAGKIGLALRRAKIESVASDEEIDRMAQWFVDAIESDDEGTSSSTGDTE